MIRNTALRLFLVLAALSLTLLVTSPQLLAQGAAPVVSIVTPHGSPVVTGNTVPVTISLKNWTLNCDLAGTPNKPGVGHWHLLLDGGLVNMICSRSFTLSLQNVTPGPHTLAVVPAENDHAELMKSEAKATFTYKPAKPLATVGDFHPAGTPSIALTSPKNGAVVSGRSFQLRFVVRNFRLSCDLMGKSLRANTGHWHVNVDTTQGPMMGMATMLNMGCTLSFTVPLAGITAGQHKFIVLLADNLHAPIKPATEAVVTVTVRK